MLRLYVRGAGNKEQRRIYEAGKISTLQREARLFNGHHPDNMGLEFLAYELTLGCEHLVLIGRPRDGRSLHWIVPEPIAVIPLRIRTIRDRERELPVRRMVRDRDR